MVILVQIRIVVHFALRDWHADGFIDYKVIEVAVACFQFVQCGLVVDTPTFQVDPTYALHGKLQGAFYLQVFAESILVGADLGTVVVFAILYFGQIDAVAYAVEAFNGF